MCYLYKNFNKKANINELEIHRSSMHWLSDVFGIFHTFLIFKTVGIEGEYWWSLEKNTKYIVMQRSRNQFPVVNRLIRKDRMNVKPISGKQIKGRGTMNDLLTTLWIYNITEKYQFVKASCQSKPARSIHRESQQPIIR